VTHRIDVDALFAAFCAVVPDTVGPHARAIPRLLGVQAAKLSECFEHPFILEAPDFIAEILPNASPRAVRDATLAHVLAVLASVLELRGAGAEEDRDEAAVPALLSELQGARNRAISNVLPGGQQAFEAAERSARGAIQQAHQLLAEAGRASLADYLTLTRAIMSPRIEACSLLARSADCQPQRLVTLAHTLESVWVAREVERDADGWRNGWRSGNAWVVCIARSARTAGSDDRATEPDLVARMVQESGALTAMHACARRLWDTAARHATGLGANRLGMWARQRAQTCLRREAQASALCLTPTGVTGA
jgi:hypothetical protein